MPGQLLLRFLPSHLPLAGGISQRGYRAYVTQVGNDRYQGRVDYEVRYAPFTLDRVQVFRGQWEVRGGLLEVPAGAAVRPGLYLTRLRPAGTDQPFGPPALLLADQEPLRPLLPLGTRRIGMAPPGAWMVFENRGPDQAVLGYTRVDVETDPGLLGTCWRFTKSARGAYWAPGEDAALRWFMAERPTPFGPLLSATGGLTLRSPWSNLGHTQLNVGYETGQPRGGPQRGLLGGHGKLEEVARLDLYRQDDDAWFFYALLPPDRRIPSPLGPQPQTLVPMVAGRLSGLPELIDLWHMGTLAPSQPDAALTMRYGEAGLTLRASSVSLHWSVIEDWEWRPDGLVSRIAQWRDQVPAGWRAQYPDLTPSRLVTDLRLVAWGLPDSRPLSLQLWDAKQGKAEATLSLGIGDPYQLIVRDADGRPFHGFLEMQVLALRQGSQWANLNPPQAGLWRDVSGRPIYVSEGQVTIGPAAHGNPRDWGVQLVARPYLVNSSVNALFPVRDETLVPNASQAAWSNPVRLTVDSQPA